MRATLHSALFLMVLYSSAARRRWIVAWSPSGVQQLGYNMTVEYGDSVTFMCPQGSFSTVWFLRERDQYDNCDCQSGNCILVSNCQYFHPNNYTTDIKRISENLKDTPDYRPGHTYYYASFSKNLSTLANSSAARSGGKCAQNMLKLELEILPIEETSSSTTPILTTTMAGNSPSSIPPRIRPSPTPTPTNILSETPPSKLSQTPLIVGLTTAAGFVLALTVAVIITAVYVVMKRKKSQTQKENEAY